IRKKAAFVMRVMHTRLRALGADWADVTTLDVYTPHPIGPFVTQTIVSAAGAAAVHGVRWYPCHPPIVGLEYEMDVRGVAREIVLQRAARFHPASLVAPRPAHVRPWSGRVRHARRLAAV